MAFRNPLRTLPFDAITGQVTADQIASVNASTIAGQLTDAQIAAIAAAKVTGQLTAAQIASVNAVAVAGKLTAAQILSLAANQITGQLTAAQIAAVSAAAISGQLAGTQLAADSIDGKNINGATLTGGLVRTAASGTRWELKSAGTNTLYGYSGAADEINPGKITVGDDTNGLTTVIEPPRVTSATALLTSLSMRSARSSSVALMAFKTGLGTMNLTEGNGLVLSNFLGGRSGGVPYQVNATKSSQYNFGSGTFTCDANGLATITHGMDTLPAWFYAVQTTPSSLSAITGLLIVPVADSATISSFKVRAFRRDTGAAYAGNVGLAWLAFE